MDAQDRVEVTSQITVNLEQLDALLLSVTESIISNKERIEYFQTHNRAEIISKEWGIPIEEAEQKVEEQLALAESLLETYPELLEAMREIYPELEAKEVKKDKIIIASPSWRGQ